MPTLPAPAAPVESATPSRGFGPLVCIRCGQETNVRLDLDDCANFTCGECDESFTAEDVRSHLEKWSAVLAWLGTAPVK